MFRRLSKRHASIAALCAVLGASVVIPLTALAQNTEDGGFLMILRLGERLVSRDASGPFEDGTTNQAITDFDLRVSSETRTQTLTLDLGAGYRFINEPDDGDGFTSDFTDPDVRLTYSQVAASSALNVSAFASRTDLDSQTTFDTVRESDGTLAADFADVTQDGGTRDRLSFDGQLSLRDDAPFGLTFRVNVDDFSYNDLPTGTNLTDFTYGRVSATARFDINPVLQANVGVHASTTDANDDSSISRYGIDAGLILTQPTGEITLDASVTDASDGGQIHLSAGRSFQIAQTTAAFGLGVARATTDEIFLTGSASFEHTFSDTSRFRTVSATAERIVTREARLDEDLVTTVSLAGDYALSPVVTLRATADYAQSENIATGDTVDLAAANLSMTYAIDRDWTASGGVTVQSRDPSFEDTTDSTTLFVGLSRSFDLRR